MEKYKRVAEMAAARLALPLNDPTLNQFARIHMQMILDDMLAEQPELQKYIDCALKLY